MLTLDSRLKKYIKIKLAYKKSKIKPNINLEQKYNITEQDICTIKNYIKYKKNNVNYIINKLNKYNINNQNTTLNINNESYIKKGDNKLENNKIFDYTFNLPPSVPTYDYIIPISSKDSNNQFIQK